jgi:4'-phosphopantetheinyl transferase
VIRQDFVLSEHTFDPVALRSGIDVWPVIIDESARQHPNSPAMLGPEEQSRAARFQFEHLRSFYIGTHAALRVLLARYIRIRAHEIRFRYSSKGKPSIAGYGDIQFNLSHSGTLMLAAFASGCDVGIDVEHIRPVRDLLDIASRFFCREEIAELELLSPSERENGFFRCWVQKEALLKVSGEGLSTPLDSFRVPLHGAAEHQVQNCIVHVLSDLELPEGYVGAVAYNSGLRLVRTMPPITASTLMP